MLEKGIALFGDELYIKHTPQMAQEGESMLEIAFFTAI